MTSGLLSSKHKFPLVSRGQSLLRLPKMSIQKVDVDSESSSRNDKISRLNIPHAPMVTNSTNNHLYGQIYIHSITTRNESLNTCFCASFGCPRIHIAQYLIDDSLETRYCVFSIYSFISLVGDTKPPTAA